VGGRRYFHFPSQLLAAPNIFPGPHGIAISFTAQPAAGSPENHMPASFSPKYSTCGDGMCVCVGVCVGGCVRGGGRAGVGGRGWCLEPGSRGPLLRPEGGSSTAAPAAQAARCGVMRAGPPCRSAPARRAPAHPAPVPPAAAGEEQRQVQQHQRLRQIHGCSSAAMELSEAAQPASCPPIRLG
jgi:hypothetical protein